MLDDDVVDEHSVNRWKGLASVFIYTRGRQRANIHYDGEWRHVLPSSRKG